MSWSIDVVGTKKDVMQKVTEQLDKVAASYDGKEEGKDVVAVKDRILSIVEAMDGDEEKAAPTKAEKAAPTKATEEFAIYVKANGSHAWSGDKIVVANLEMRIGRTSLAR
jgi:hypothetical protein